MYKTFILNAGRSGLPILAVDARVKYPLYLCLLSCTDALVECIERVHNPFRIENRNIIPSTLTNPTAPCVRMLTIRSCLIGQCAGYSVLIVYMGSIVHPFYCDLGVRIKTPCTKAPRTEAPWTKAPGDRNPKDPG